MGKDAYEAFLTGVGADVANLPPWDVLADITKAGWEAAAAAAVMHGKGREIVLYYPVGSGKLAEALVKAYNDGAIELKGLAHVCRSLGGEWEAMYDKLRT